MKTIQKKIIAIAIMFVMALTTIFYSFTFLPKTVKADEDLSSVDLGKYDSYTDTDEHGTDVSTEDVADTLRTLKTHAPDKLQEAMDTAKLRRESKRPPFRSNSSSWTK